LQLNVAALYLSQPLHRRPLLGAPVDVELICAVEYFIDLSQFIQQRPLLSQQVEFIALFFSVHFESCPL